MDDFAPITIVNGNPRLNNRLIIGSEIVILWRGLEISGVVEYFETLDEWFLKVGRREALITLIDGMPARLTSDR